jgi:hypothetical protein
LLSSLPESTSVIFIQLFDQFTGEVRTLKTGRNCVFQEAIFDFTVPTVLRPRMILCPAALARIFPPQVKIASPAVYTAGSYQEWRYLRSFGNHLHRLHLSTGRPDRRKVTPSRKIVINRGNLSHSTSGRCDNRIFISGRIPRSRKFV